MKEVSSGIFSSGDHVVTVVLVTTLIRCLRKRMILVCRLQAVLKLHPSRLKLPLLLDLIPLFNHASSSRRDDVTREVLVVGEPIQIVSDEVSIVRVDCGDIVSSDHIVPESWD